VGGGEGVLMLLGMRPRADTVYPFSRAQSRTACT
jgi:hypothetical protein